MHPQLAALLAELDRLEARADTALAGIDAAAFARRSRDGGWSIAQVFEHLCVADASYVDRALPKALARARRGGPAAARTPRPSLLGGWLVRALADAGRKLTSPRAYRVGAARPDAVARWRAGLVKLRALIRAADGADLGTRLSSPIAWFVRMTLAEALALPIVHGHRHLAQVERLAVGPTAGDGPPARL